MQSAIQDNLTPLLYAAFNIAAVTAIVIINKRVFKTFDFHFPVLLILIHTCMTYTGVRCAQLLGFFERKALPSKPLVILAASFVFYNCASQVNLNINTVGFYQISKILVTPAVMIFEFLIFQKNTTTDIKMAVGVMLVGVGLATVSDVQVGVVGFVVGMIAVLGAAQSQILIGHTQKKLEASSNQVLLAYTPFVVPMLILVSYLDIELPENQGKGYAAYGDWYTNKCTTEAAITIFVSGCLGLLVSLSTFLLIGATNALTYNIVGHTKTMMILLMGVVVFGDDANPKKLAGVVVALMGVFWYSKIKLSAQDAQKRTTTLPVALPSDSKQ
eukprot:m.30083 g.30083  ORF g.30083 m.30083 type:complete len:329 (+) comp16212_c0_seq1:99-1085(+)